MLFQTVLFINFLLDFTHTFLPFVQITLLLSYCLLDKHPLLLIIYSMTLHIHILLLLTLKQVRFINKSQMIFHLNYIDNLFYLYNNPRETTYLSIKMETHSLETGLLNGHQTISFNFLKKALLSPCFDTFISPLLILIPLLLYY